MSQKVSFKENKKYIELNESKKKSQNLWDKAKTLLREKFVELNAYIKDRGKKSNSLNFHFKSLENEE